MKRKKIIGNKDRLRLKIFRGNKNMYAQLIDDEKGHTVLSSSTLKILSKGIDAAKECAIQLADKALEMNIKNIVFDRGSYLYKGRIKVFIEQLRDKSIKI